MSFPVKWYFNPPDHIENVAGSHRNEKLFNSTTVSNVRAKDYTGDGVSTLFYLLNGTGSSSYSYGANWNHSYSGYSSSDPANVYSRSRIRATLTGDSADASAQVQAGGGDFYGISSLCDESNCLLSCFPKSLQSAVVPRTTVNSTSSSSYADKTTYDKLFLFSMKETGINNYDYDDCGGTSYGVTGSSSARTAYEFSDSNASSSAEQYWYLRSRTSFYNSHACLIARSGIGSDETIDYCGGLSPGFCIA